MGRISFTGPDFKEIYYQISRSLDQYAKTRATVPLYSHANYTLKQTRLVGLVRCDKVEEELVTELSQQHPDIFLSTFMTEMNRMFNKAGIPNGVQAMLASSK